MFIIIWFLIWLFSGFPPVYMWNGWAIWLAVCIVLQFMSRD